jgi:hypothetical protein
LLFALIQLLIDAQLLSGHGAFHKRTGGSLIAEKGAPTQGLVPRLIRHLLAATHKNNSQEAHKNSREA